MPPRSFLYSGYDLSLGPAPPASTPCPPVDRQFRPGAHMKPAFVRPARVAAALLAWLLSATGAASAKNTALDAAFRSLPAPGDPSTQICLLAGNEGAWYARWKMI